MYCELHDKRIATGHCAKCHTGICEECKNIVKGQDFCPRCAQNVHEAVTEASPHHRNLFIAFGLSLFIPGMGQVYNGQVLKGIVILLTAWLIIPWGYGVFDAPYTAYRINNNEVHTEPSMVTLSGCLVLTFMVLLGPLVIFKAFRDPITFFFNNKEKSEIRQTLRKVAQAAEKYADDTGIYPTSYSDLYFAADPYIDELYCDLSIGDYTFSCIFTEDGYTVKAIPKEKSKESFAIITGEKFRIE